MNKEKRRIDSCIYSKNHYKKLKSSGIISYTVRNTPEFIDKVKDFVKNLRLDGVK